jgi:hypothetical protein
MNKCTTNPFGRNRAEQMGKASWKYYVSPEENLLSETPLIFEGSRGTGKTMFMLCNSWREKFSEFNNDATEISKMFTSENFIGIYYKVDGRFVGNNLSGKGVDTEKWISIFNSYFNVIIAKEIYEFIRKCIDINFITNDSLESLNCRVARKIDLEDSNLMSIVNKFDDLLDSIESFTNDPDSLIPKLFSAGTLIKTIIEHIKEIEVFEEARFHILIDEYEELNEKQQMQINTLIKQSVYWLVYDVCVKTNGIYTYETISNNEIIQEPHDYRPYRPELNDYNNSSKYIDFLKNICRKRLGEYFNPNLPNYEQLTDIEFYLFKYHDNIIYSRYKDSPKYKKEIIDILTGLIDDDPTAKGISNEELQRVLFSESPLIERMHISLLRRKDISVKTIYNEAKVDSQVYIDWKHNTLYSTHFLLCNELGLDFQYHGLKVFAQLSSGVIRYFIEICKCAFDNAISNGFTFSKPRSFSISEQTNAAQFVSETKVAKIDGFVPGGKVLKRLILNLGKMYYLIQTNKYTTLGEPEVNHFTTSLFELKTYHPEASKFLDFAVMHNILQTSLPTKTKSNDVVEIADYHLNHIYCPYFKISHRRKRKITLDTNVLNKLILGTSEEINKIIKKYDVDLDENKPSQGKLF